MSRRNLTVLLSALLLSLVCYARNEQNPRARYVAEAYGEIDKHALMRPGDQELVAGAMRGMVGVLRRRGDEHSGYSDPGEADRFLADIRQEFGGVGVRIRFEGDPPRLTAYPEPGGPAFEAGLLPGDRIEEIDGQTTAGMTLEQVLPRMRGPVGKAVGLLVARGEEPEIERFTVELVRSEIETASLLGDRRRADGSWVFRLEPDPRIAVLRITTFGNKTAAEFEALLPQLLGDGVEALVIDLRDNPGGALDVAIEACNLFLPAEAAIVSTKGRGERVRDEFVASGGPYAAPPIAVLINDLSASAAEIMAACFQDNGRSAVVGERSFGKGTVQQILRMESGRSLLKVTTASFWRPSGFNIHRMPGDPEDADWGVRPDAGLEVELSDEQKNAWRRWRAERDLYANGESDADAEADRDAVFQRAVDHLKATLAESP